MPYICLKDRLQAALDSLLELDTKTAADHISIAITTINHIEAEMDKPEEEQRPFVLVDVPAHMPHSDEAVSDSLFDYDEEYPPMALYPDCCPYCGTDLDTGYNTEEQNIPGVTCSICGEFIPDEIEEN